MLNKDKEELPVDVLRLRSHRRVNMLLLHLIGGALAMAAGLLALFAAKGATVHRRAGTFFVYAMLSM